MRTTALTNAAILAGVADAQLLLPVNGQSALASPLLRRDLSAELAASSLQYSTNVSIGTPPQEVSLFLSLDSDTTWVPAPGSCYDFDVCPDGEFDSDESSSFDDSNSGTFSLNYGDSSSVNGLEFADTIRIGDVEIDALTMGVGWVGEFTHGELSIGPAVTGEYSLLQSLVDEGIANSAAFSFSLGSDATSGNLLFGAIDALAFDGPLKRIRTRPNESSYTSFPISFSSLDYTRSTGETESIRLPNNPPLLLIQPTTMLTNLPYAIAREMWDIAGATYDGPPGLATIPCSGGTTKVSELIFGLGNLGGATVRVSFDDLVIPHYLAPISSSSVKEQCVFAIQSMSTTGEAIDSEYGPWALGGFVLRNTYMAFDLVNGAVAFAPTRLTNGGNQTSDIVAFPSFGAEIPQSEDADPICPSEYSCDSDLDYDNHGSHSGGLGITVIVLSILGILFIFVGFTTLIWFLWYKGRCCWRGRRRVREAAPAPQSGPISEKIVYAGAMPGPTPPRPTYRYAPGPESGQLPLGCAWLPPMVQSAAPVGPSASVPVESGSVPSGTQPDEPRANSPEAENSVPPPTSRPASPSPPSSAGPSPSPQTPAASGVAAPHTKDEAPKPRETGDEPVEGRS